MSGIEKRISLPDNLSGVWAAFDDLSARQVHGLLKMRQDVFMLEQNCLFPEIDGKDPDALHFLLLQDDHLVIAAVRIFLSDDTGRETRIGRVVVHKAWRGKRLGDYLMAEAMKKVEECRPGQPVHLSAQAHLEAFYEGFGFKRSSEIYLEDGIEHVDMIKPV
ncbi:GNAT family N-acetyltransferase [Roseibium litorale]|uniref:GNAT family N-acetyltransferase n=1 Tax=Roseibium litorale TaxID=2803841 RepID=A0ABR9CIH4_9HYPH|nr:GNAT family N-acetyltransferase [Roseibium litorale]MBD8890538.1 GNAT family N-acetyltransferase [Roseibium litorale]